MSLKTLQTRNYKYPGRKHIEHPGTQNHSHILGFHLLMQRNEIKINK